MVTNYLDASISSFLQSTLIVTPSSLTFPTEVVGRASPNEQFVGLKVQGAAIDLGPYTVTGPDASDFFVYSNCKGLVGAPRNCYIHVHFGPLGPGLRTATLDIPNNSLEVTQTVALTGRGTIASISETSVNFGTIPVGQTSGPYSLTLTDVGSVVLNISSIAIVGANASDFSQTNTCGSSLQPGASCTINLSFTPSSTGVLNAQLSITNDGGSLGPQSRSAVGYRELAYIGPLLIAFGPITVFAQFYQLI